MSDIGNKDVLANNLNHYMKMHRITRKDLSINIDVPYSTVSDWLNAKKYPRIDKIEKMANLFGIKKSDLIEKKDTTEIPTHKKSQNDLNKFLSQAQVVFDGELYSLDDDDRQLVMKSLEVAFAAAKQANKRKK